MSTDTTLTSSQSFVITSPKATERIDYGRTTNAGVVTYIDDEIAHITFATYGEHIMAYQYSRYDEYRLPILLRAYQFYPVLAPIIHLVTTISALLLILHLVFSIVTIYPYISLMILLASSGLSYVLLLSTKAIEDAQK